MLELDLESENPITQILEKLEKQTAGHLFCSAGFQVFTREAWLFQE